MLREEVTSGRLDAAESKAKVLQGLCEQLKFSPEAAGALHKSLYRQKIDSVLEEKKKIGGQHLCISVQQLIGNTTCDVCKCKISGLPVLVHLKVLVQSSCTCCQ